MGIPYRGPDAVSPDDLLALGQADGRYMPASGTRDSCQVYRSTTQSIANATDTQVVFNATGWDESATGLAMARTDGIIIRRDGRYVVSAFWPWAVGLAGRRHNMKVTHTTAANAIYAASGQFHAWENIDTIAFARGFVVGDIIKLTVAHDHGSALNGGVLNAMRASLEVTWLRDL